MTVRIRISSLLLGSTSFNQLTMVGQNVTVDDGNILPTKQENAVVSIDPESSTGYLELAIFNNLNAGKARFYVEGSDDYHWRSGVVDLTGDDQELSYVLMQVNLNRTTFSESQLEDSIELPIVASNDDDDNQGEPHEIISAIKTLDINIKSSYLRFSGDGYYGRRDIFEGAGGIDFGSSDYEFTYKLRIKPGNPIKYEGQLLKVEAVDPIEIAFSNPIVGFVALFMQNKINNDARKSIEDALNERVQEQIDEQVGDQTDDEDLIARVTANVIQTSIDFDPQEEDFITFNTLLSFPKEFTAPDENDSGGSGCSFGVLALFVFGFLLIIL